MPQKKVSQDGSSQERFDLLIDFGEIKLLAAEGDGAIASCDLCVNSEAWTINFFPSSRLTHGEIAFFYRAYKRKILVSVPFLLCWGDLECAGMIGINKEEIFAILPPQPGDQWAQSFVRSFPDGLMYKTLDLLEGSDFTRSPLAEKYISQIEKFSLLAQQSIVPWWQRSEAINSGSPGIWRFGSETSNPR